MSNPKMNEKEGASTASEAPKTQITQQALFRNALMVTKHSNQLLSTTDWEYCQSFPQFPEQMKMFGDRITQMMSKIYNHYGLTRKIGKLDLEEQLELVSDYNDALMERINLTLDEAAGLKKQAETVMVEMMAKTNNLNGSWNRHSNSQSTPVRLLSAKNISRPQLKFKEKINNKPGAFVPKIKDKPHSVKPLSILLELNDYGEEEFSHPYEFELENFTPNKKFFRVDASIAPFQPVAETPLVMVDNEESLKKLIADLETQTEIAVDLEAHSYRTFQGLTCLLQISTMNADYIVDTLELWEQLSCLNEVFCNPNIVKILHGADKDIEWLQRDFGIYIVNMFDTYQAAKLLNFPHLSLAYLLRHYCQVLVNKEFQLADWRIRPIPQEMINYAREDTHYLRYVYQRLKSDLINKGVGENLLVATWANSRLTCLKKYRIPDIGPDSHMDMYRKSKMLFNDRQMFALRQLFVWRDKVAREEDESLGFVLPKHMMLQIANVLPREMQGILACCSPIPPLVRQHLLTLHKIILKAREMPLVTAKNEGEPLVAPKPILPADTEDVLSCVHDLAFMQDIRDDLPTLISESSYVPDPEKDVFAIRIDVKSKPQASIFSALEVERKKIPVQVAFTTPFARFTHAREAAKMAKKQEQEATAAESDERIEKIRQLFIATVAETEEGTETGKETGKETGTTASPDDKPVGETEGLAEAPPKKRKRLPLSTQLPKIKRKRTKKNATPATQSVPDAATTSGLHDPADIISIETETGNRPSSSAPEVEGDPAARSSSAGPSKKKRMKQMAKDKKAEEAANFQPFDYSQVDYQIFQRNAPKNANLKNNRARVKDRLKMNRKRSQKSMTYSTKSQ